MAAAAAARRVFVLGGTGDQGRPLIAALRARGHRVTAGVRDPASARAADLGVPLAAADIGDAGGMAAAMAGHDALALHLPFVHDVARAEAMARAIAEAAQAAGIGRIVFNTSCFVADRDLGVAGHDGRRAIERVFAGAGAAFVSLRPMVFMDNLTRPWARPAIVRDGVFAYPAAPALAISWIAIDDVAACMAAAVERDGLTDARIAIGGPEALAGAETAIRLARALGRPVAFRSLPPETFAADMSALVTGSREVRPASVYDGMARLYAWYNAQPSSPLACDPAAARDLMGRDPVDLESWAGRQHWRAD
ncbi:SDR family oxidoreductase [Sphingomonas profundi]|uniref:SDR family oxidoreductase n=1 Tax=Alterirhizorhabdus profundi TaxID=2681549 RepID=UPI0012E88BA5|nr:NmrA family NAD(P)-binding protein [Sphingomonas profundi]